MKNAIDTLVEIDFNEVVIIKDKYIKEAIQKEVGLESDIITAKDMLKLTKLTSNAGTIENIEVLKYAKNLKKLDLYDNQIRDISPLKGLNKLKDINMNLQYIVVGMLEKKDNKVIIEDNIIGKNGKKIDPSKVQFMNNKTGEYSLVEIDKNKHWDGDKVNIDLSELNLGKYLYKVNTLYNNREDNHEVITMYMIDNK